jgi:hypothetical protein
MFNVSINQQKRFPHQKDITEIVSKKDQYDDLLWKFETTYGKVLATCCDTYCD